MSPINQARQRTQKHAPLLAALIEYEKEEFMNRLINWFKKTTFEGTILKDIGLVNDCTSSPPLIKTRMKVQAFRLRAQPKLPAIRLNLVFTAPTTYQSMPFFVSTEEARKMVDLLNEAIEEAERGREDGSGSEVA